MKGYVYYYSLPYKVRELFKGRHENLGILGPFNDYLNREFSDMSCFISGSFLWAGTEEGYDYWYKIAFRDWKTDTFIKKSLMKHTL